MLTDFKTGLAIQINVNMIEKRFTCGKTLFEINSSNAVTNLYVHDSSFIYPKTYN